MKRIRAQFQVGYNFAFIWIAMCSSQQILTGARLLDRVLRLWVNLHDEFKIVATHLLNNPPTTFCRKGDRSRLRALRAVALRYVGRKRRGCRIETVPRDSQCPGDRAVPENLDFRWTRKPLAFVGAVEAGPTGSRCRTNLKCTMLYWRLEADPAA